MRQIIIILFLLILFNSSISSQIYFNNNYEYQSQISNASSVVQTNTGEYLFPSCNYFGGTGSLLIFKISSLGDTLFTKEYKKNNISYSTGASGSMIKLYDGNYAISGALIDTNQTTPNALLIKLTEGGDTLWTKTYGGANFDNANIVHQTADSGFVLMGVTQSYSTGPASDFYMIKTDKNGNFEWQKIYGTTAAEDCTSGDKTLDGGFILSGQKSGEFYIVKTDALGNMQWQQTYSGTSGPCFIKQLADSTYILTGAKTVSGFAGQAYMIKVNKTGGVIWQKHYGSATVNDWFYTRPIILNDGSIVIAGQQMLGSIPIGMLVKTDSLGNQQWLRTYYNNPVKDNYVYDVKLTLDNGFILSGFALETTSDAWLVKVDSVGCEIAGCNVGIEEYLQGNFILNVYPNPSNNTITITVSEPTQIKIINMLGEVVIEKQVQNNSVIDINDLSNGIYFIQTKEAYSIKLIKN
ncbi:MAG: T9SS type A sorting domain-containing protein [Bacteroidia bacterium]|nr:T9SS type A sorting domain-containing protein [Bacteroidia bacterium]